MCEWCKLVLGLGSKLGLGLSKLVLGLKKLGLVLSKLGLSKVCLSWEGWSMLEGCLLEGRGRGLWMGMEGCLVEC